MLKTFTFDGKNTSDFHVKVGDSGIYEAPVRSVQHSYIPRKNGSFITDNRYFEDVIIFYQAVMTEGFGQSFDDLRAFLSYHANTYFRLEDEFRQNHFRMAKFEKISGLRFAKQKARFDIYFRCKPQLFLKAGESSLTFTDLGGEIENPTLFESKPLIRVTGQNGDVYINDIVISVENSPYEFIDIDCELMKCTHENDDADKYVSFSGNDFPVLKSGTNRISVSTETQAIITPRWYTL